MRTAYAFWLYYLVMQGHMSSLTGRVAPLLASASAVRAGSRHTVRRLVLTSHTNFSRVSMAACQKATASEGHTNLHLTDAHCHPQLDPANMQAVLQLKSSKLAAMSVSYDVDWEIMLQLHQLAGSKVVPGFGIHPWWSHLHASSQGDSWQQLLEAPSQQQLQAALDILSTTDPVTNSGAYATNRPHAPGHTSNTATAPSRSSGSSDGSFTGIHANISQGLSEQQRCCLGEGLRVVPQEEWQGRLRQLLTDLPGAIVGEVGIDRSATIPGSRARTSLAHQMELLKLQVAVAAEFQRPVSVHCVKGYGHLLDFFAGLAKAPDTCPPKVMLHSYGGSVEEISRFCKLPNIGERFYFSFSHAINHRTPEKLRARVAAVPDDKLLLESDQVTPLVIDDSLVAMCEIVADVKGWTLQDAAHRLGENFRAFY